MRRHGIWTCVRALLSRLDMCRRAPPPGHASAGSFLHLDMCQRGIPTCVGAHAFLYAVWTCVDVQYRLDMCRRVFRAPGHVSARHLDMCPCLPMPSGQSSTCSTAWTCVGRFFVRLDMRRRGIWTRVHALLCRLDSCRRAVPPRHVSVGFYGAWTCVGVAPGRRCPCYAVGTCVDMHYRLDTHRRVSWRLDMCRRDTWTNIGALLCHPDIYRLEPPS